MTSRIGQPDTDADRKLRECLDQRPVRSFIMVAGAGSGKTTSLVKALSHLAQTRGAELRRRGQRIACITYTEVAVGEIWSDVGNVPLFHISTIYSFLWTVVSPFQIDLRRWVGGRIGGKIAEAEERIARPRTQARTRARLAIDIEHYRQELAAIDLIPSFTYGTGSDYAMGILGHDDILKVGPELINTKPLLRSLVASRFPFIFVDESQDTWPDFVNALRLIEESVGAGFCLGFFGDPMQKIYLAGIGPVTPSITWNEITKPENFRCPTRVLDVINRIRAEDDGLRQVPGRTAARDGTSVSVDVLDVIHGIRTEDDGQREVPERTAERDGTGASVGGSAHIFILPADGHRTTRLDKVRHWLAAQNDDPLWHRDRGNSDVRMLVLVHRMAATRLGFPNVYAALNDGAPASFKSGLRDGTIWVLRHFCNYLLPLVLASRSGADFDVIAMLRINCPLLSRDRLVGENVGVLLGGLSETVRRITAMFDKGFDFTIRDVIAFVRDRQLATLDSRFLPYLEGQNLEFDGDDEERAEQAAVAAFLGCRAAELWGYRAYIEGQSPFVTQQDVKGAEFERVLVVLDDEESDYNLFSYGKYFGITPLSDRDKENLAAGVDLVLGRTRRLFYVCCSRALRDLAVVLFVPDVAAARAAITTRNFFPANAVHDVDDLDPNLN